MSSKISGASIEECLEKACNQFGVNKENLQYTIIKNEKRFFKKIVEIEVTPKKIQKDNTKVEVTNKRDIKLDDTKSKPETVAKVNVEKSTSKQNKISLNHGAKVEKGKIIVSDFDDDVSLITIEPCENVILYVNGVQKNFKTPVSEDDEITYEFVQQEAVRDVKIGITTDKLEAYVTINYTSQDDYRLLDCEFSQNLKLETKRVGQKMPPKYTERELKEVLEDKGVRYGIIEDQISNICSKENVVEQLVARGVAAVDDIPDQIKLYFSDTNELIDYDTDDNKVDYRNRYLISNVKAGDVVAELIPGKEGKDGINVLGLTIKKKPSKKLLLRAGANCSYRENKVISTVEGKPAMKGCTISVNQVYKCEEVDLKSGNINFVGNVEVAKNVEEGMEVIAGQDLSVGKNVEAANIQAGGQIVIGGNAITSTIKSGSDNVAVTKHKDDLVTYKEYVSKIIETAEQLKDRNMLGKSRYGEIVKLLIENKFKNIPELSKRILKYNNDNEKKNSKVSLFIINKMMAFGPLKIEDSRELERFVEDLDDEIDEIDLQSMNSADIYVDYIQGCTIESSGNIIITGKGQYTSNLTALGNIEFTGNNAVCRGGTLSAGKEIKLKTVGSVAGVNTILKVPKYGKITAEVAYNNTMFCFGEKQTLLEVSSKDLTAFIDKKGEIVIEKFVL